LGAAYKISVVRTDARFSKVMMAADSQVPVLEVGEQMPPGEEKSEQPHHQKLSIMTTKVCI
jgi:hypothetical protein